MFLVLIKLPRNLLCCCKFVVFYSTRFTIFCFLLPRYNFLFSDRSNCTRRRRTVRTGGKELQEKATQCENPGTKLNRWVFESVGRRVIFISLDFGEKRFVKRYVYLSVRFAALFFFRYLDNHDGWTGRIWIIIIIIIIVLHTGTCWNGIEWTKNKTSGEHLRFCGPSKVRVGFNFCPFRLQ